MTNQLGAKRSKPCFYDTKADDGLTLAANQFGINFSEFCSFDTTRKVGGDLLLDVFTSAQR